MTLRAKLLAAQIPLALALVVLGWLSLFTVSSLGESSDLILRDNYRSVLAAQRMKEAIERLDSAALFLVAGQRARGLEQARTNRPRFEAELAVEESNITEPGETEAARQLRAAWERYWSSFERLVERPEGGELAKFYFEALAPPFLEVKGGAERILEINQDAMVRNSDEARDRAQRMNRLVTLVSAIALVAGVAASTALTTRLLRPLDDLGNVARRLGEGDLEARAAILTEDEIGMLGAEFNEMAERVAQYRQSTLGELLQAQETSQAAIDSIPDPVVVFDSERHVLNLNEAGERLLDAWRVPAGESPLVRAEPSVRAALERVVDHVLSGRGAYVPRGFEEVVRAPSASGESYLLPRAAPLRASGKGIAGVTVILQDVTRLRRFEELHNDLVATVAHEFRTPLTSLRMAIHLCVEGAAGPLTEKQLDLLHAAREDCERLQRIVDELLDLARIESGATVLALEPVSPEELLQDACDAHRGSAEARGVTLACQPTPRLPEVLADHERAEIAIGNLVSNALRHAPSGSTVVLAARPLAGAVRFDVTDSGPGVPADLQERIFDRFFRVPGAPAGGSGLGLSIAKEIALAHGGAIGVESVPGQGATFWLTLRSAKPTSETTES